MVGFAYGVDALGDMGHAAWLKGLRLVAVAVVAQAVWSMARSLCPDRPRATSPSSPPCWCWRYPRRPARSGRSPSAVPRASRCWRAISRGPRSTWRARASRRRGAALLALFCLLLVLLPALAAASGNHALALAASFYRVGALIFGGGHVMLPLLQAAVVRPGWASNDAFLAGYGAAQAVPGPLSSFAGYLGVIMRPAPNGWVGALLCVVSIFAPSFLLVAGTLPFWAALRGRAGMQAALRGVNAAVVGILLAALFSTMWVGTVVTGADFGVALGAFLLLAGWAVPPWVVVLLGAAAAAGLAAVGGVGLMREAARPDRPPATGAGCRE